MAKWASTQLLDGGSDYLRTLAGTAGRVQQHIIKAYTAGDSYSTVTATNSCGSVDMAAGDFVQSGAAGATRVTTVAAKGITLSAGSGAAPNLHVVLVDSVNSAVLLVTDESTDQVLTSGNTFNVPAWEYAVAQPA